MNKVDVLLGLQWGDEGKGKIVDVLSKKYDIIARFQEVQMQAIRLNLMELSMCYIQFPREFSMLG